MKNIAFTLLLLFGLGGLPAIASAADHLSAAKNGSATDGKQATDSKSAQGNETVDRTEQNSSDLVRDAAERRTPPWTNDSANVNQKQPRTSPETVEAKPYSRDDFTVKPEWKKLFADHDHFSTTSGKELYGTMCQVCHMRDGQGARGAGDYPSFVGNERLRSPDYPIDVILNGLRGMPPFGDQLSNQQIADVVNYLRTNFGNQLDGDATGEDAARVRH